MESNLTMLGRTRLKRRFFLDGLLWLFLLEFGIMVMSLEPGFLDFDNLPDTNFTCVGKVIGGYYADLETNCQMFHVCTIGQSDEPMDIRFLCLNGTVFDQETRVCERIDEVDCSKSEQFYSLNLELYGNTPPAIQEESADDSETDRPLPKLTTTTTTKHPLTTKFKRPPFYTSTSSPVATTASSSQGGKHPFPPHHFSSVSSTDIRFNPEEINISLNAGAPPDIRTKHHQQSYKTQFSDNSNFGVNKHNNDMFSDNNDYDNGNPNKHRVNDNNSPLYIHNSNLEITAHSSQYSELGRMPINNEDSTTQTSKSVFTINHSNQNSGSSNSDLKTFLNSGKFADPSNVKFGFSNSGYQTEYLQVFKFNNPENYKPSQSFLPQISEDVFHNKQATITYHPPRSATTTRTLYFQPFKPPHLEDHNHYQQHQTEKPPQRVQIPIPVLPSLPPLTFSSPAPFSLTRHIDAKRYTKDHPSPPRIIISASASVTDDSGRRLNYSLGTIGAAHILDTPPASYDDYKDGDVGLDPFYHDVPKVERRRRKRSTEFDQDASQSSSLKDVEVHKERSKSAHIEMLNNPEYIEEILKFFGTIKDEKDLERLLPKRSADPQLPQNGGKINVFDIIRNEKEAVEVLKFLFTWYKSHQATATAPSITIPVSPEIISRINYEFAPKDSLSDSSELRYTTRHKESSTLSTPALFTPKNIPVMYLDYLDGIKIETRHPKLDNNLESNQNQNRRPIGTDNQILNNSVSPIPASEVNENVNVEPVFDVNDYVNDNYEPEVLKYWGKQSGEKLSKQERTGKEPLVKTNVEYNNEPFRESVPLPTLFPSETISSTSENPEPFKKPKPLLPPRESIHSLAKEVLVQHYYLTSTDRNKKEEAFTEGIRIIPYHPRNNISDNATESLDVHILEDSLHTDKDNKLESSSSKNLEQSTTESGSTEVSKPKEEVVTSTPTSTTTANVKSTSIRNRHRGRHRYPYNYENKSYLNNKIKDDSIIFPQNYSKTQTTTSTETSVSTKITKSYRRITTTRPVIRGRFRYSNRKLTTEQPLTTIRDQPVENLEHTTEIEINTEKYQTDNKEPEESYVKHDHNDTQYHNLKTNRTYLLNTLDLNYNLNNTGENETFYTELPLSIELQPPYSSLPYEVEKLKNSKSVLLSAESTSETNTKPLEDEDDIELFKSILKTYDLVSTTQETVVPIYYKKRNRIESEYIELTKRPIKSLEIIPDDDTTTAKQDITTTISSTSDLGNISIPDVKSEITNLPIADTTATTPVVGYSVEDILATTFPSITESIVPEPTHTLPETTTKKSKKKGPNFVGIGKSRFAMNIEHHSIKKQLAEELEDEITTTESSFTEDSNINIDSNPRNLLLNEYIFATSTETITKNPLEIVIPLDDVVESASQNQSDKEHTSHTKTEIVSTNENIKSLLHKEKVDVEEKSTTTAKNNIKYIRRGRFRFLDHYSTTTPENLGSEDDDQKIKSVEVPTIPYEGLKANTEDQQYIEETTQSYDNQEQTTIKSFSDNKADKQGQRLYTDSEKIPTTILEDIVTSTQKLKEVKSKKVSMVPQILKYLISEIETTANAVVTSPFDIVETTTLSSANHSSTPEAENFFVKNSKKENYSDILEPILMDTTEKATTESSINSIFNVPTESMYSRDKGTVFHQQMEVLKNSSHLLQVLVENSTQMVEGTALPVMTTSTVASSYRRRTRPSQKQVNSRSRQIGRHRFSTELFTRNPIDVTQNEIESNDKITDTPLHRSVPPTSENFKTSPTPSWRRSYQGSSKRVGSNYVFNCFGKELNTFYSDPRDCRLFHYCTPGYSKNQLLDLKYVCDLKTYFDDEKLICSKIKPKRCL